MNLAMLFMIGDQMAGAVLRGLGKLKIPLIIMLVVYYLFYQPVSLYFAFNGYYLYSVWGFTLVAELIITIAGLILVFKYNWHKIAVEVQEKMKRKEAEQPLLDIDE